MSEPTNLPPHSFKSCLHYSVCVCVRACVHACVRACVCVWSSSLQLQSRGLTLYEISYTHLESLSEISDLKFFWRRYNEIHNR